jgi:hypothetical protein
MIRIEAQAKVVEELEDFVRLMSDDVLNTSEMVSATGLLALDLARSIAKGNAEHRSTLAPVLDALRNMTKYGDPARFISDCSWSVSHARVRPSRATEAGANGEGQGEGDEEGVPVALAGAGVPAARGVVRGR